MAPPYFHSGTMVVSTEAEMPLLPEHVQVLSSFDVPQVDGVSTGRTVLHLRIPTPIGALRRNRPGYKSSSGAE